MTQKNKRRKVIRELIKVLTHQDLNPEFYPVRRVRQTRRKLKFYMEDIKGLES